jgi:ABC-type transport system involved in cytochrome bd biosynthesis fused ATPase/permease subunit
MKSFLEELVSRLWNRFQSWRRRPRSPEGGTELGVHVADGETTRNRVRLSIVRRTMHVAILGKTGSGKSSLIRHLIR